MSRFTVWQEITVAKTQGNLTYGKFYTVWDIMDEYACILDDVGVTTLLSDNEALTIKEYQQAEREKGPFAPGNWVVCVEDNWPARVGDVVLVTSYHTCYPKRYFISDDEWYSKSHFRPATPEEIKE